MHFVSGTTSGRSALGTNGQAEGQRSGVEVLHLSIKERYFFCCTITTIDPRRRALNTHNPDIGPACRAPHFSGRACPSPDPPFAKRCRERAAWLRIIPTPPLRAIWQEAVQRPSTASSIPPPIASRLSVVSDDRTVYHDDYDRAICEPIERANGPCIWHSCGNRAPAAAEGGGHESQCWRSCLVGRMRDGIAGKW